jgi:hypothetical protein
LLRRVVCCRCHGFGRRRCRVGRLRFAARAVVAVTARRTVIAVAARRTVTAVETRLLFHAFRPLEQRLHRQLDAALLVGLQHLDLDDLAFLQEVGDVLDPLVRDLADVQQTVLARQDVDEGTEVQDLRDRAFVDLADLGLGGDLGDAALRELGLVGVGAGNRDRAVFADVDRAAGFFGQRTDRRAALADDVSGSSPG